MTKTMKPCNYPVVELAEGVFVHTGISDANLPALRSGFAGYPANPRWNAVKFHAWKTGRQLRQAVACGEMVVRSTDSMLVPVNHKEETTDSSAQSPVHKPLLIPQLVFAS